MRFSAIGLLPLRLNCTPGIPLSLRTQCLMFPIAGPVDSGPRLTMASTPPIRAIRKFFTSRIINMMGHGPCKEAPDEMNTPPSHAPVAASSGYAHNTYLYSTGRRPICVDRDVLLTTHSLAVNFVDTFHSFNGLPGATIRFFLQQNIVHSSPLVNRSFDRSPSTFLTHKTPRVTSSTLSKCRLSQDSSPRRLSSPVTAT